MTFLRQLPKDSICHYNNR